MDRVTETAIRHVMSELGRRRTKALPKEARDRISSKGGRNAWKHLSKQKRSTIMKARALKRWQEKRGLSN